MLYYLNKVAWFLLDPATLLGLALLLGVAGLFAKGPRLRALARGLLVAVALAVVLIAVLPPQVWTHSLESRFSRLETPPDRVDGIIVLGGGLSTAVSDRRGHPELNQAGDRVTTLLTLARRYPDATLVYASGGRSRYDESFREADAALRLLGDLGLPPGRLTVERDSRNTRENAIESRQLAAPQPDQTWLLVTSAFHMPRAVGAFRKLDWPVVAYPVDYLGTGEPWQFSAPNLAEGLQSLRLAAKEWLGMIAYRFWGWSDDVFPSPAPTGP